MTEKLSVVCDFVSQAESLEECEEAIHVVVKLLFSSLQTNRQVTVFYDLITTLMSMVEDKEDFLMCAQEDNIFIPLSYYLRAALHENYLPIGMPLVAVSTWCRHPVDYKQLSRAGGVQPLINSLSNASSNYRTIMRILENGLANDDEFAQDMFDFRHHLQNDFMQALTDPEGPEVDWLYPTCTVCWMNADESISIFLSSLPFLDRLCLC